ncbi:hypothetical protein RHMOL_Rhmol13G0242600 [Rhododendron molle]|uniref:Uncharacterized protein n=1 Tax=Rhododendron molle TaxID=49168 RepID=A0ACC0LB86_RHOML|nr:hypothetical protein RHMOL_Rhmol13G0242600 [Rhododendron molle]
MVIRDSMGCFMAAHSISLGSTGSAQCAEAAERRWSLLSFWDEYDQGRGRPVTTCTDYEQGDAVSDGGRGDCGRH